MYLYNSLAFVMWVHIHITHTTCFKPFATTQAHCRWHVVRFPNPLAPNTCQLGNTTCGTGHEVQLEHYVDTFHILRLFVKDLIPTHLKMFGHSWGGVRVVIKNSKKSSAGLSCNYSSMLLV